MLSKLYLESPSFVQNAALSIYGAKVYRDRFGGSIPDSYLQLNSVFAEPNEEQYRLQNLRLSSLLEHSVNYVPHYRELLKGRDWRKINSENLADNLPKLTKKDILADPNSFLSTHPDFKKRLLKLNTSGSTGTPLNIYCSYEARRINYYFYQLALKNLGSDYRARSTTFAGRILYKENSKTVARFDKFNNTQYLSSYYISETNIEKYIQALNEWAPEYIDSYPSALFEIQQLARKQKLAVSFKPKFILTSSETLTHRAKEDIESFFDTKIIDHYGCTEMVVSAFSDGEKYYAQPLYSILETESHGDNCHSLIATGLLNFAMPLIRYELGDYIYARDLSKPYIFESIQGRLDDAIVTPEGRKIGRMDPAFKGIEGIEAAQVIQQAIDKIHVKVVLSKGATARFNEDQLIKNIQQRTSSLIGVEISYHETIEKGSNGKFKSVLSQIN